MNKVSEEKRIRHTRDSIKYTQQKKVCCATCKNGFYARVILGNDTENKYKCGMSSCLNRSYDWSPINLPPGWTRLYMSYAYKHWEPYDPPYKLEDNLFVLE